ncbi:hypothetical protein SAMN05216410_3233 [Sanguibacter gelidistatuariae]|uniref:Uncharacterized protein n=1 Tax=Sanguibacter gelidistatuariae TaxID=1814289 RepID=A0A1G6UDN3_9MICO|nr:hypothetical protein [Sanguibacter gelidistatuariae]SDD39433.1 hypothetical protein SAMN05216410_3233 [Sanguibacter gelidistatuariae]
MPQDVAGVAYTSSREGATVTAAATPTAGYVLGVGAEASWTFDVVAMPCATLDPQETPGTTPPAATSPVR